MKEKRKIEEILKIGITMIAIIVLAIIVLLNIRHEVTIIRFEEHTVIQNRKIGNILISLIVSVIIVVFTNWIHKLKIPRKIKVSTMIVGVVSYIVFQVIWIKNSNIGIYGIADSEMIYGSAMRLFKNGEITETLAIYLAYYKQNIGLVVIFENLMKLFQTDIPNLLRYVNVVANVFTIIGLYSIYKMVNKNEKEQNGLLFYILMLGFLPISLLCIWIYGDFIGLALSIWSIVFIIKYVQNKKIRNFIFSCISMALAIMTRSNSLIFIIAIAIYLLFTIREEKTRKERVTRSIFIGLFIILSIMPNKILTSYFSNKHQLNDKKEKSSITYLYMGMSEGGLANGWYNNEIGVINEEMKNKPKEDKTIEEETKEKLKQRMQNLIQNPIYTIEFYKNKILSMWAEPTMASEIYNTKRGVEPSENKLFVFFMEGKRFEVLKLSQKIIDGIIYTGALMYVILKRKNMSNEMLLLVLVFLGGFSFHLLWEAKSRYVLPYVVILIPVAVEGINEMTKYIRKKEPKKVLLLKKGESQK